MGDGTNAQSAEQGAEAGKSEPAPASSPTPDKTADQLDVGWGERPRDPDRVSEEDERLLRERPPHWE